jgi:hypothetical protein
MEGSGSESVQVMTNPDPGGAKTYGSTTLLNSVLLFFAVGAGFIFLCTSGAVYGCLEIHLDFIKVVCFYIISLYNGLADQWGRGGGQRTRDH